MRRVLLVLSLIALSVIPFAATSALGAAPPELPGNGHVRPPIRFTQVAAPVHPAKPGQGKPGGTTTSVVYPPATIQSAYDFGSSANGSGQTIAIIVAYGDTSLSQDVATFDSKFGVGAPTINVYTPDGAPASTNSNWAVEAALDVEWAHADAPNATIDVVVAPDSTLQHLLDAVNYAVSLRPNVISMSWGASETTFAAYGYLNSYEAAFSAATGKGIALVAASGDQGAYNGTHPKTLTVDYPASSPEVIGVGGTTLNVTSAGAWSSETAWSSSGGGYSVESTEPGYQIAAAISDPKVERGVPDVAFDADPNTGVYVYTSGSWYQVGGTSVGAPNWAGIVADSGTVALHSLTSNYIYDSVYTGSLYGTEFHDITSGKNGYYSAGLGWDAVTGVGTPDVSNLINGK